MLFALQISAFDPKRTYWTSVQLELFAAMSDLKGPLKTSARMNKPYYCDYAGVPTIVGETGAWSFVQGAWKEINHSEAYNKARLIGEHEFRQLFGELPPLPPPAIVRFRK